MKVSVWWKPLGEAVFKEGESGLYLFELEARGGPLLFEGLGGSLYSGREVCQTTRSAQSKHKANSTSGPLFLLVVNASGQLHAVCSDLICTSLCGT